MRFLILILVLFPLIAFAQGQPGMPQMDMEKMQKAMQQMDIGKMQEAMACMKDIDQSALEGLEKEGKKIEAELDSLCKSGNREEAQSKAMGYAAEMMSRPELIKIRECSEIAAGMLPQMPFDNFEEEMKDKHVCDG